MKTFSVNDGETYRTHKEICDCFGYIPSSGKSWYLINNHQYYLWAPKMTNKYSNWNELEVAIQNGKEVQWVNYISEDGKTLYEGAINNNERPKNTLPKYSSYLQVVFGKFKSEKDKSYYYKFLGVFKYSDFTVNEKGVQLAMFTQVKNEITL